LRAAGSVRIIRDRRGKPNAGRADLSFFQEQSMKQAANFAITKMFLLVTAIAGLCALPATAVPVSVDLSNLRAIQTYPIDKSEDQAYLLVTGIANGKEFSDHLPKDKTWTMAAKKPVGTIKEPVTLWKGDLADGEFALVTVTLMQGKGADEAKIKEFLDKKSAAEKKVAERAKPKLTQTEFDTLHDETLKVQQALIKDIKKVFSREMNTDHFGGLFNVAIWNNGGKIVKRVDPAGLTFGEHFGIDPKIYTKIKNTRANVMMKDEATGEWSEGQVTPLNDDQDALRVKMLETELIKTGGEAKKNTTDYLAEIQVKADGKALKWELNGIQSGPTDLHTYWDFAE
jgi:hypothetical protein